MRLTTTFAIMFSLTLLVACGGGGGGSTASTGSPAGTGGAPTGDGGGGISGLPTIQVSAVGGWETQIRDDEEALSGLDTFTASDESPTMEAVRKAVGETRDLSKPPIYQRYFLKLRTSYTGEIGKRSVSSEHIGGCVEIYCNAWLPGDPTRLHLITHGRTLYTRQRGLFDIDPTITNLTLVNPHPESARDFHRDGTIDRRHHIPGFNYNEKYPRIEYFADSTYESKTSSIATVDYFSFARGIVRATRRHDNAPLEFQTFAGWLDGSLFGTTRIKIEESGREQYRFTSYYVGSQDRHTRPSGTGIWKGAAVASIKDVAAIQNGWSFIRGDATIEIDDLANPNVDLRFDNWHTINGRAVLPEAVIFENVPFAWDDTIVYTEPDNSGVFGGAGGHATEVFGWFHGNNQEQVGGYFQTDTIAGAFGAVRQPK